MKDVNAGALRVAYLASGASHGKPVILLHGFPHDVHAFDDVTYKQTARSFNNPDFVDVVMPGMNGKELRDRISGYTETFI